MRETLEIALDVVTSRWYWIAEAIVLIPLITMQIVVYLVVTR